MKIALVQAPVWWTIDPPLGLAQVAGCVKAAGHDVRVFDLNILLWKDRAPQYANMWLWEQFHFWNQPAVVDKFFADNKAAFDGYVDRILRTDARVIGFAVNLGSQLPSLKLAAMIKAADPSRLVAFGGQYFFLGDAHVEMLKHPQVDVVVRGAADDIFPGFVGDVERLGRLARRPGIVFRDGNGLVDGGEAPRRRLLDDVPFSDFTGFPMELYEDQDRIPLAASRGCIWACRFCSTREFWDDYSHMSGDRIFAEVIHQAALFPNRGHVEFYDITANGNPEALSRFSDLMIDARLNKRVHGWMGWKINAVLRPEMTADLLKKMRAAGCKDIIYGVESGSPRVLKRMNKHYNIAVAERVLHDTHAAGIRTTGNFMFGFPGETEEEFRMTLAFLERNHAWLTRAYGSATFTSLEEFSYLTEHQEDFGIRRETEKVAHNLYWVSADGQNTYPVRLDRYKRFRETCIRLGIDAYKGINGSLEQDRYNNLAEYHQYMDERIEAIRCCLNYLDLDLMNEPVRERLSLYRDDLRRLERAARLVERANDSLGRLNGQGDEPRSRWAASLSSQETLPIPTLSADGGAGTPLVWTQRYLARAQRILARLRYRGFLKWHDGRFAVFWEKEPLTGSADLRRLRVRVETLLDLASAEAARGGAAAAPAACAR